MKKTLLLFAVFLLSWNLSAQQYTDYLGGGHNEGVTVTSSSDFQLDGWTQTAAAANTFNGQGLDAERMAASRFLAQASIGFSEEELDHIMNMGYEAWVEEQFEMPAPLYLDTIRQVWEDVNDLRWQVYMDSDYIDAWPNAIHYFYTWWQVNTHTETLLRQKIAFALSETLVISSESDLWSQGEGLADYYDMLQEHAFGNYRDLLYDLTLHPCMAFYLSHLNNIKTIPEENIHPDENYARELMQLFSIGLYELNQDGTYVLDVDGNPIPTYDNSDIKEFAKVFTGLGSGGIKENPWTDVPYFGMGIWVMDMTTPLVMYEDYHELGEKYLLNDFVVPDGQTGLQDISDAIDNLFNHPNVGPFIGRRLIQRMVKSNPSPAYISRVAAAFNDNGNGVRGDMKAVIRAILFDEEARSCEWSNDPANGMLREPIARALHVSKALTKISPLNRYWNPGYGYLEGMGQYPTMSPSVFNFFLPDHQPSGAMAEQGLYGPEFQIHHSITSIGYINWVYTWTVNAMPFYTWEEENPAVTFDFTEMWHLSEEPEVLVNKLDMIFTHGRLSQRTRDIIIHAIDSIEPTPWMPEEFVMDRTSLAIYLLLISPDYAILK